MPHPNHYPNGVFSAFALMGFVCCCIPFPWHLEAWNTGTCLYMFWAGLGCLNQFINSVVWNGNAINWAPVWCDISARLIVGSSFAIPAASLCINRRLYHIASVRTVTVTKSEKRRNIMVDLAIGMGIPVLGMILQYIPQGHRFNIFEDVGCYPFTYNTPVAFALVLCPPVLIGLVSAVYCTLSIRNFWKRRSQFNKLLSGHNNLNSGRYVRLMCLAGVEVLLTVPLGSYGIYLNAKLGIPPWKGWADTHSGFSRVDQIPSILWRSNPLGELTFELTRWSIVICAFIFFIFFGFADEAKKNYRSAIQSVAKRVGFSTSDSSTSSSTGVFTTSATRSKVGTAGKIRPAAPVFVHREMLKRPRSVDSFTNISVSFQDAGGLLADEKEAPFSPVLSYGALTLSDVGGTLADYSSDTYSPPPSSGSSSSGSSVSSPSPALTRESSEADLHVAASRTSVSLQPPALTVPLPTLNINGVPRHQSDQSPV